MSKQRLGVTVVRINLQSQLSFPLQLFVCIFTHLLQFNLSEVKTFKFFLAVCISVGICCLTVRKKVNMCEFMKLKAQRVLFIQHNSLHEKIINEMVRLTMSSSLSL